jgi:PhnB protein
MLTINPYLNFPGNTEEAFLFYRSVFGGEFLSLQRYGETPEKERLPASDHDKIMHVALPIGNGNMLMGTDALPSMGFSITMGNNHFICISPDSVNEGKELFERLGRGGIVTMQYEKAFWGDYFGMVTDRFGVQWMVSAEDKKA